MIDFRYHLISLIAVFLALGIGIVMGSVVLDEAFLEQLQRQVSSMRENNARLESEIQALDARVDAAASFATQAAPWLLDGAMTGQEVLLMQFDGVDGDTVGGIRDAVELGGGRITGTFTMTDKFALRSPVDRDQLALISGSTSGEAAALRAEAATLIGNRIAEVVALPGPARRPRAGATGRLQRLVSQLESDGFLALDEDGIAQAVAPNARVVIVGGGTDAAPFDTGAFSVALGMALSERDVPVLAAEPLESSWEMVVAVREDGGASADISTVDQANTPEGRIAVVLGVERDADGTTGHYGVREGATEIIPEPTPAS